MFGGSVQALNPELMDEKLSQKAVNTKLIYGDLRPWKNPLTLQTLQKGSGTKTIYRFGESETNENNY